MAMIVPARKQANELGAQFRLPNFVIIGAMKSATTTLWAQLSRQNGICFAKRKEPNFFSDDERYALGIQWYSSLFEKPAASDILGEASTHYTHLPTYPQTVARMQKWLPNPRLIYVMRDPVDRLISHYLFQSNRGKIHCRLDEALTRHPELIAYSCYSRQLTPFIEAYGKSAILPVFFDRLIAEPRVELERIFRFIGYQGKVTLGDGLPAINMRLRRFPFYNILVEQPLLVKLRRNLLPKAVRMRIRELLSASKRPRLTGSELKEVEKVFDDDLAEIGRWLGVSLDCRNFRTVTATRTLDWR